MNERMAVTGLRIAHSHLNATLLAATRGKVHAPRLKEFVPDIAAPAEPAPEHTFESFARALIAIAR